MYNAVDYGQGCLTARQQQYLRVEPRPAVQFDDRVTCVCNKTSWVAHWTELNNRSCYVSKYRQSLRTTHAHAPISCSKTKLSPGHANALHLSQQQLTPTAHYLACSTATCSQCQARSWAHERSDIKISAKCTHDFHGRRSHLRTQKASKLLAAWASFHTLYWRRLQRSRPPLAGASNCPFPKTAPALSPCGFELRSFRPRN